MSTETKAAIFETNLPENETAYQPPAIDMCPVESSNIESVGHDGAETLRVKFKNGIPYDYVGISEDKFLNLVSAPSVGKAYGVLMKEVGIKGIKLPAEKEA